MQCKIGSLFFIFVLFISPEYPASAVSPSEPSFSVQQLAIDGIPVVRMIDATREMEVSVLPSHGYRAFEMKVRGKNVLYMPDSESSDFLKRVSRNGIPFMAPWANRLDSEGFWANGKRYSFNSDLGNFWKDENGLPIHGLIMNSTLWRIVEVGADQDSAFVTGRLELWKHPDMLAQWPFAHEYEMTYRLSNGSLEVRTTVSNLSSEAMPLLIGFHPYFTIPGIARDRWILHLPVRKKVVTDERQIPTGVFTDLDLPNPLPLKDRTLDHGFTDMKFDAEGRATFSIEADKKRIDVILGPKYPVAQIWQPASPPGQAWNFICIEPMTGVTNGMNLNHAGDYPDLQVVPAFGKWTESFWIRPEGF
ncbi:MAG: aldose 1-epimerase [Acidobacteria bacterium]|nr:aldose 1-epimerase [Acidobacteriota bacterium]